MITKKKNKRRFTGKLTGFASKKEAHFCKRQLKAYLKGAEYFKYKGNQYKTPFVLESTK